MAAFYPGAGLDITPIILFPHITEWYYMDSQPRSECGSVNDPGCEQKDFLVRLKQVMTQIGMECLVHTHHSLFFIHPTTHCKVTYYINSVFPLALEYCYLPCTTLVACGFRMSPRPPLFMSKFTHIICNNKTNYDEFQSEWVHATISTIVWDEECLDENRTIEFVTTHTKVIIN